MFRTFIEGIEVTGMRQSAANIGELLLAHGRPADVAVVDRTGRHDYGELRAAVRALASHLDAWGLEPGSRIGLLARNSFFWVAAYLAVLVRGHVAVPFAPVLTAPDIAAKARFVGCDSFLVESALRGQLAAALTAHVADEAAMTLLAQAGEGAVAVDPDADAVLAFTSGTTASPRAVRVSHRNLRANTEAIVGYLGLRDTDRILVVLPFSYCFGASLLHTHLAAGASLVLCETAAFPETVVAAIRDEECTGFAGVPSTYQQLLRASTFESAALPTLRTLQQAGGRLPPAQADRVAAAQPTARLFIMYGQTEATARLSYLPPELREERRGSIGRGLPGVRLRVVDADGATAAAGTVGEIVARGESITAGYWHDPEGTAAKLAGGELHTGDLGYADEDGFIYIVDRQDDFIKSWGFRVSSHEVEDAVLAAPGVTAAAAVGRPDEAAGEAVVVFYTAAGEVSPAEVLTHCRTVLAKHLVPSELHRLPELPLNQNGKVLKARLRVLAAAPASTEGGSA